MEKLYRGPYIDAYCQVWFHLAKLFQRRRLNQRQSKMAATTGHSINTGPNRENTEISSSLKLLHWLKLNYASIIGRSFTNFVFFMLIVIPRWLHTMTCGGSHLGFPIGIKNRGPSNDHSWAVWFRRRSVLKHFSHRVKC
jgi:hypothetical protein